MESTTDTPTTAPAQAEPPPAAPPAPPVVVSDVKDARARLLRTKAPKFELAVVEGAEYSLVVPSEGVRGDIAQIGLDVDARGRIRAGNRKKQRATMVIAMVHTVIIEPSTGHKRPGAKVFADADLGTLINEPAGPESVVSMFGPKCEALLERVDAGLLEAAKNG